MVSRNSILALVFAAACFAGVSTYAADEGGGSPPPPHGAKGGRHGGGAIKIILKHADDLKLTDEQKTKLEALAKSTEDAAGGGGEGDMKAKIEAILTPDQLTKLKEIMKNARGEHGGGDKKPGGGDGDKKPGGDKAPDNDDKK